MIKFTTKLFLILAATLLPTGVWGQETQPSSGAGTSGDPYIVTNAAELDWVTCTE